MNSIDLCAIVPFFVTLVAVFEEKNDLRNADNMLIFNTGDRQEKGASLSVLRVIRLVRVFRFGFHACLPLSSPPATAARRATRRCAPLLSRRERERARPVTALSTQALTGPSSLSCRRRAWARVVIGSSNCHATRKACKFWA